jgi:hypothetical protein
VIGAATSVTAVTFSGARQAAASTSAWTVGFTAAQPAHSTQATPSPPSSRP